MEPQAAGAQWNLCLRCIVNVRKRCFITSMLRDRRNNFSLLRLLFAGLVVLSHSPELMDGDRHRELATRLWGTMSLGEIGVDGFFLVSGYLITQSFLGSASTRQYLVKRVLRIYPAFLVASMILLIVVAPMVGAAPWGLRDQAASIWNALVLGSPTREGVFHGLPYQALDGAMWSIRYEFNCYLMVIVLGFVGLLLRPAIVATAAVLCLFGTSLTIIPPWFVPHVPEAGFLPLDIRMGGVFLVGMSFFLLRDRIAISNRGAAVSTIALFLLMFFKITAEPALAIFGGYLIFWLARVDIFKPISARLKDDVSYGLYLYGWPIGNLMIFYGVTKSPWLLAVLTIALASIAGYISWKLVEQPMLRLKPKESVLPAVAAG